MWMVVLARHPVSFAFACACACAFTACGGGSGDPTVDAPRDDAASSKRVFVTSTTYAGDLATASGTSFEVANAGFVGANKLCQTAATAGELGGTWKAIVAQPDGGLDALADVGPWYLLDGMLVFNNRAQLETTPLVAIAIDEQRRSQLSSPDQCVWTGLQAGGTPLPGCAASGFGPWTFANSAQNGVVGTLGASDSTWIYNGDQNCNGPCRLYCIEQ